MAAARKPRVKMPGWIIRSVAEISRLDGSTREHVSWWYGPTHGWGTTYGSILGRRWIRGRGEKGAFQQDSCVAVFATRKEAEQTFRSVYGRMTSRYEAQRVEDAIAEQWADLKAKGLATSTPTDVAS